MVLIAVRCPSVKVTTLSNGARLRPPNNAIGAKTRPAPIKPLSSTPRLWGTCRH